MKIIGSLPFRTFDNDLSDSLNFAGLNSSQFYKANEAKHFRNFIYRINRYVKKLQVNNPNITPTEVEEIFKNDLKDFSDTSYCGTKISQSFMEFICYDLFYKQPDRLKAYMQTCQSINIPFNELEKMPRSSFSLSQLFYAAKLKNEFDKSGFTDINYFLKKRLDEITPRLNQIICESTLSILKQLDKLDLLHSYLETDQKKMTYLNFPEFSDLLYKDFSSENLLSIFSNPDLSKNKTPYELLTLYSFWINRYSKELDTYLEAMFTIRDFNLIPSMLNEHFSSPSKETLKKELAKLNLFYNPSRFVLETQKAHKLNSYNGSEYDIKENIYSYSNDLFIKYIQSEYGDKYKKYFDNLINESKNDLVSDAAHYFDLYSPIFAAQGLKDATMLYLLIGLKEGAYYANAGIVPNIKSSTPSTMQPSKFTGIAFNSGMRDTYLLHMKTSVLKDFINNYMKDDIYSISTSTTLPIFTERFDYTSGKYSVPILAPLTEEDISLISKAYYSQFSNKKTKANPRIYFTFI